MQSITKVFNNISNSIKEAVQPTPAPHVYTRNEVIALEEAERERRMHQSTNQTSLDNARRESALLLNLRSPYLHGSSAGFKRITKRLEEQERARRLMTKPELALRKMNANLSAGMIRSLGWPFLQSSDKQGPVYIYASEATLLAEEERLERINNPLQAQIAKSNAAFAANALRWGWTGLPMGNKRHTRNLEEKERARRLSDRDELAHASEGAYRQSALIRNLGRPFFVQDDLVDTASLEQQEQSRRLSDKNEQVRARQHAAIVSRLLPIWASGKSIKRAEQERARRMSDAQGQQQAREIAKQVATIVAGTALDEQLEHERERRIKHAEHDRLVAHQIADLIQGLRFSKSNAHDLYEKEARRRLRDATGERIARQNANKIAALVSAQPTFGEAASPSIASVEEVERKQRMYDWPTQQMHMKNARKASDMIKAARLGRKQSANFATEKERNRRMVDAGLQAIALQNAKKVSDMVRDNRQPLRSASSRSAPAVIPSAAAMAPVSFFPETSIPRDLPSDFMPPAETMREVLPFQGELLEKRAVAPPAILPFKNELLDSRSQTPALLPFKNELLERQPSFIQEKPQALPFAQELLERQPSFLQQDQQQQRALPFTNELLENTRAAPAILPFTNELLQRQPAMASAPISNIPMASAPLMSEPLAQPFSATNPFAPQAMSSAPLSSMPLSSAPLSSMPLSSEPLSSMPLSSMPFSSMPLSSAPLSSMPSSAPLSSMPLSSAPLSSMPLSSAPLSSMPVSSMPFSSMPLSSEPLSSMPLSSMPLSSAPLSSMPLSSAPLAQPSTPLAYQSNRSVPPMSSTPVPSSVLASYYAPVSGQQAPMTSGLSYLTSGSPLPSGAPLGSSASFSQAPFYPATASTIGAAPSFYSAAGEHAMTEQQSKRLEKQALKHNRKASKDNRQAQKLLQKAEKLHARGKESRALKKENKAEQKVISSKQHALWANDLLAKNGSAAQTPVAQAPTTFFPAM